MYATLAVTELIARVPMLSAEDPQRCTLERLGGLTNQVYRLRTPSERWIVRIPGRGVARFIDRSNELAAHESAVAAGIALPLAYFDPADGLLVRVDSGAEPIRAGALHETARLEQVARLLAATHALETGATRVFQPMEELGRYMAEIEDRDTALDETLRHEVSRARRIPAFQGSGGTGPLCHVDPVPENFLCQQDRLYLMDWEYAGHGPPIWDLADLVAEADLPTAAAARLLAAYREAGGTSLEPAALTPWIRLCHLVAAAWARAQAVTGDDPAAYDRNAAARLARARRIAAGTG